MNLAIRLCLGFAGSVRSFDHASLPLASRRARHASRNDYQRSVRFRVVPSPVGSGSQLCRLTTLLSFGIENGATEGESGEDGEGRPPSQSPLSTNKNERDTGSNQIGQETKNDEETKSGELSAPASHVLKLRATNLGAFSEQTINGAGRTRSPDVMDYFWELTKLTRPANFPGICVFHMLGVYLALDHVGQANHYWRVLLADPTMWLVLSALILTSSTSMVINDYYDAKLGRDIDPSKPLVSGAVPLHIVRHYLSYLYAAALMSVAFLPSVPARLSVVLALMLTYWYTKHLKPITWIKNVVCAALIAFSPFTSGSAALFRTVRAGDQVGALSSVLRVPSLWRLVSILFVGFVGREMTMDCNDVEADKSVGVLTVPVTHGTRFASRFGLLASVIVAVLTTVFPAADSARLLFGGANVGACWATMTSHPRAIWRLVLALTGSSLLLRRSWQVYQTEGKDKDLVTLTVDEGLLSVLFVLASFV
ncbi:hypothetical protein ACA910_000777 [Epithemia clementina (nom. ined.)]